MLSLTSCGEKTDCRQEKGQKRRVQTTTTKRQVWVFFLMHLDKFRSVFFILLNSEFLINDWKCQVYRLQSNAKTIWLLPGGWLWDKSATLYFYSSTKFFMSLLIFKSVFFFFVSHRIKDFKVFTVSLQKINNKSLYVYASKCFM